MRLFIKLLFFFYYLFSYSQDRVVFFGKISDELGVLENVHILNLNTNQATSTNLKGEFKIFAKTKDSLKITFVGYKTKTLTLSTSDFGIKKNLIKLKKETIKLDEIAIKKHNLQGVLSADIKQTPKDFSANKLKGVLDFSNIDFNKKVILPDDEAEDARHPDINKTTDPTQKTQGITLARFSIFTRKKGKRLKQRLDQEKHRDQLPYKIINTIGKHNFTQEFKIPQDKIFDFLEYCEHEKLSELSSNDKVFQLIEFLTIKSKSYLKLIKENK